MMPLHYFVCTAHDYFHVIFCSNNTQGGTNGTLTQSEYRDLGSMIVYDQLELSWQNTTHVNPVWNQMVLVNILKLNRRIMDRKKAFWAENRLKKFFAELTLHFFRIFPLQTSIFLTIFGKITPEITLSWIDGWK